MNFQKMLGRKSLVKYYLSAECDKVDSRNRVCTTGYSIRERELEKIYQDIANKYTEIRMHGVDNTNFGEYVTRYLVAARDAVKDREKGVLDVFVLEDCINKNVRLSKIMGRNITIIDETNVQNWEYILSRFPKVKFAEYWDQYINRDNKIWLNPQKTVKYFTLTKEEEDEGKNKKRIMGLTEPFVCVASRDAQFLRTILPKGSFRYHDYRDSDINRLNLAVGFLGEKNITTVRMGRYVKEKVSFENCIDYANQYYDELMDIVLLRDCKFYMGDSNGLCVLPMAMNRPIALKNVVPISLDAWGAHPQNKQNLYIFKKYYKKSEERFLSIKEMMEVEKKVGYDGRKYRDLGIEVVENSAEEILDLAMEMNARIDGDWVEQPEDAERQEKYRAILTQWIEQEHLNKKAMLYARVGAMFLKKNSFLL